MQYNYDYFISYAHKDNVSEDGKSGFVDEFVKKLQDSPEHRQMFGRKIRVFYDKSTIHNMTLWDNDIRSGLASSRFLIVLLSPNYFKSEYCAKEFDWWMKHEMHRCTLGEGTAPMIISNVGVFDPQITPTPNISPDLKLRYPNWLSRIKSYQSDFKFDMHEFLISKIDAVLKTLRDEVKNKIRRQEIVDRLPYDSYPGYNENFVGRRENLLSLRRYIIAKSGKVIVALTGLGGFGKTELALTYGHAFGWDYRLGRFFKPCENCKTIYEAILGCGIQAKYKWKLEGTDEEQLNALFDNLKEEQRKIINQNAGAERLGTEGAHLLLIFDNVNNLNLITQLLDRNLPDFIHIIITTRKDAKSITTIHTESVESLSDDESVELLNNLRLFGNPKEAQAARKIAHLLAGFTLAVEITGAYLANNECVTYQEHYDQLNKDFNGASQIMVDELLTDETRPDEPRKLKRHSLETIPTIIKTPLSVLSDAARKALEYASLMPPDAVALGWIPELLGYNSKSFLSELTSYCLVAPLKSEPNIARIHRLVAETVKQQIIKERPEAIQEITAKIRAKCETLLKNDETFWCTSENAWNITPVSEFCMDLANQWTVVMSEEEIDWKFTRMLVTSGDILSSLGKMTEAREVFQRLCDINEKLVKMYPSNYDALRSLSISYSKCGDIDNLTGKIKSAKDLIKRAITNLKSIAEKYPNQIEIQYDLVEMYEYLGYIERGQGNLQKTKKYFSEAFSIFREVNKNSPDPSVLRNWCPLYAFWGELENVAGNAADSCEWYEMALDIHQNYAKVIPDNIQNNQFLSVIYSLYGDMKKIAGNISGARECYEKALEIDKQLNDKIPEKIQFQQLLCSMYARFGDLERDVENITAAQKWYEKFHALAKQLVEKLPENFQSLNLLVMSNNRLGIIEEAAGNIFAVRELIGESIIILQRMIDQMPKNFIVKINLCNAYLNMGDLEDGAGNKTSAREWYKKAQDFYMRFANKIQGNFEAQRSMSILYDRIGSLKRDSGNISAAREFYKKALEIDQRLADKVPNNVYYQHELVVSYMALGMLEKDAGNIDAARKLFKKALVIIKRLAKIMPENADFKQDVKTIQAILYNI